MKHKVKVVMLPTADDSPIIVYCSGLNKVLHKDNVSELNSSYYSSCKKQHIYITVSQDIIGGKEVYYIDKFINKLTSSGGAEYGSEQDVVIATTDPKLTIEIGAVSGTTYIEHLPQLQQSFLKEFISNPNGEYEVEYEWEQSKLDSHIYGLKLNQDNTVNIISVKEKMIPMSMLLQFKKLADAIVNPGYEILPDTYAEDIDAYWNWIKENL
tara:strand:- start:632 stop:1264 length:633 start_codon:yes stop_codon:yes gene_type:complete